MEEPWERAIMRLSKAFTPGSAAMLHAIIAVEEVIAEGFQQNFYNQLDEQGNPWPPRKDSKPHPLLIKTGKMFEAATNTRSPAHFSDIEGTTLITGISDAAVPYAKYHHTGTRIMPARRVIYATKETLQRAAERFEDSIEAYVGG